jgi:hypothetical protein
MKVMIKGVTPIGGIHQIAVGGRFFPTDSDGRLVDVLDQPDDPPQVLIPVVNSTTGVAVPTLRPDPDRMGRKSYEEILKDGRFQVIQTDVVDARASGAMVAAARAETQRLAGENSDLKIALAQTEAKLAGVLDDMAKLANDHEALKKHAAELEEMIGNSPAKPAETETTSETTPAPEGPK